MTVWYSDCIIMLPFCKSCGSRRQKWIRDQRGEWKIPIEVELVKHRQTRYHSPMIQDSEAQLIRNTIMRYINLAIAMTLAKISPVVGKQFPSLRNFMVAGYITKAECKILEDQGQHMRVHKVYVPILWACKLVEKARTEGRIRTDGLQKALVETILTVKGKCGELMGWNDHNIPLVYTQVVTIAVYSFFAFSILGEQILDPSEGYEEHNLDIYFPIFGILQLLVYVGWIKVAEALLNPFGDDDHDFEFMPLLERHLAMSDLLCNSNESDAPALLKNSKENSHICDDTLKTDAVDLHKALSTNTIDSCA